MANIEDIQKKIEEVLSYDVKDLLREGRDVDFLEAKKEAEGIKKLYGALGIGHLENIPQSNLDAIYKQVSNTVVIFQKARDFKIEGDVTGQRAQIISEIKTHYTEIFKNLSGVFSIGLALGIGRDENAAQEIEIIKQKIALEVSAINNLVNQANEAVSGIKSAAAEGGITPQSIHFANESTTHNMAANWWLCSTGVVTFILVMFLALTPFLTEWFDAFKLDPNNAYKSINIITSKTLIFAALAYALFLSVKNYSAHRHNSVVNKHRQNALLTYQAIVAATDDPKHKDVVLNHAASCIFAPQDSGYAKTGEKQGTSVDFSPKFTINPS